MHTTDVNEVSADCIYENDNNNKPRRNRERKPVRIEGQIIDEYQTK